jgi:hypothetical protein
MVARFRVPRTRPLPGASRPTPYIVERKVVRYVRLRFGRFHFQHGHCVVMHMLVPVR